LADSILLVGKESSGKSMLAANLTGRTPVSTNFRGSTVACEAYSDGTHRLVDTPGILLTSDSQTTQIALERLELLLPCLVTALTIARELSVGFALRLMARQALAAIVFTLAVAWGGLIFVR
jgi:Fe2+ transport system protein B